MKPEHVAKYPDFLLEFEDIKVLAKGQRNVITSINSDIMIMMRDLKLNTAIGEGWDELICDELMSNDINKLKLLHRKFPVTTLEVLKNYIRIWLVESKAVIEYDKDAYAMTVKFKKATDKPKSRKWTRNILPCNMVLNFEIVEELS